MANDSDEVEYWNRLEDLKKRLKTKTCIAVNHGNCQGKIIAAHTIPRSQLSTLATAGHVMAFPFKKDEIEVKDKGIKDFSVLNCFCQQHDASIFAPLENAALTFDSQQLTLLHFRAVGAEMYKKSGQVEGFRANVEHYKNKQNTADKAEFFRHFVKMSEVGLHELEVSFSKVSDDLSKRIFDNVSALKLEFEEPPSIMTVGAFAPAWDYNLNLLQRIGDLETLLKDVSLSVLNVNGEARVAIIWEKSEDIGSKFAHSILDRPTDQLSTMIIKTAFHLIENTCANAEWWNALKNAQRHALKSWMLPEDQNVGMYAFSGVSFPDWRYSGHRFVNV